MKAELAALEEKAEAVRAQIIALGIGAHEGDIFRATVSMVERDTTDWKGIAQTLKPSLKQTREYWSEQIVEMVDSHTVTKTNPTVRVVSRKGKAA
jgi:hypothetical protein